MPAGVDVDAIGPVDVAVILFECNQFHDDIAPALVELQESGQVRIIDLAFVMRDSEGNAAAVEIEDTDVAAAFDQVNDHPLDLLNDEDLQGIADGLDANSSALAIVWENRWAARLARAVRESNGELIVQERIPRAVVVSALQALDEDEE
jgi:hypothetical protein